MDRFIARLNIEHFRKLLAEELEPAQRQMIMRLLAEEEAKLKVVEESQHSQEKNA